jgi:hypothetical protein
MRHLMAAREGLLIFCVRDKESVGEEEYDLCARQFESMPNLVRRLVREERLPSWAGGEDDGGTERS